MLESNLHKKQNVSVYKSKLPRATILPGDPMFTLYSPLSSSSSGTPFLSNSTWQTDNVSNSDAASNKRSKSKLHSNRKRSKMKYSNQTSEEEKNIDIDLLALAQSVGPNQNADSDSSQDTINLDEDKSSSDHSKHNTYNSSCFRDSLNLLNNSQLNVSANSSLLKASLLKDTASFSPLSVSNNSCISANNSLVLNKNNCYPVKSYSKTDTMFNLSNFESSFFNSYSQKNPSTTSVKNYSSSLPTNLSKLNFSSNLNTVLKPTASPKISKKSRKDHIVPFMYDSKVPSSTHMLPQNDQNIQSSFSNVMGKFSLNDSQKCLVTSSQSVYAEMGLDEDLCDVNASNFETKSNLKPAESVFNINPKPNLDLPSNITNVVIKKERESPERELSLNSVPPDVHISMTFEAEPFDEDDDLPLSFLKSKISIDDSSTDINPSLYKNKPSNDFVPTFIKQELIEENEVLSITNCSVVNAKNTSESNLINNKDIKTSEYNYIGESVKIKPEPITEYENSETLVHGACAETVSKASAINLAQSIDEVIENVIKDALKGSTSKKKPIRRKSSPKKKTTNVPRKRAPKKTNPVFPNAPISDSFFDNVLEKDLTEETLSADTTEKTVSANSDQNISSTAAETLVTGFKTNLSSTVPLNLETLSSSDKQVSNIQTASNSSSVKIKQVKKSAKLNKGKKKTKFTSDLNSDSSVICNEYSVPETHSILQPTKTPDTDSAIENCWSSDDGSTVSRKKSKKKKQNLDLDENLPINLLIKRQKTSPAEQSSESFICTSLDKPASLQLKNKPPNMLNHFPGVIASTNIGSVNSSVNSSDTEENSELMQIKEFLEKGDVDFPDLQSDEPDPDLQKDKSQKSPKEKSVSTKRASRKTVKAKANKNNLVSNLIPSSNLESDLENKKIIDPISESIVDSFSNARTDLPVKQLKKKSDTVILMSFEEQSSPEESAKEFLDAELSPEKEHDTRKSSVTRVPKQLFDPTSALGKEAHTNNKHQNNLLSEKNNSMSKVSSEQNSFKSNFSLSGVNNQPIQSDSDQTLINSSNSNSPATKKRRRAKSYGWYKKKGKKASVRLQNSAEAMQSALISDNISIQTDTDTESLLSLTESNSGVEKTDVTSISSINDELVSQMKMKTPVVRIQNLGSGIENITVIQSKETEETVTESTKIPASKKRTKKRRGGNKWKRKKKSSVPKKVSGGKNIAFDDYVLENHELSNTTHNYADPEPSTISEANLGKLPSVDTSIENTNDKSAAEDISLQTNENPMHSNPAETITIEDSPVKPSCFPFRKGLLRPTLSIAAMEKEIAGLESYVASSAGTSSLPLTTPCINSSLLNSSVLEKGSDKPSNTNFLNSSFIQVKKENNLENSFSSSSRIDIPFVLSKNTTLDNSSCSGSSIWMPQPSNIKKEKIDNSVSLSVENESFNAKESKRKSWQILSSESETCKKAVNQASTFADEIALNIKKETFHSSKSSEFPSVSNVRNIQDLIEKSVTNKSSGLLNINSRNNFISEPSYSTPKVSVCEDEIEIIETTSSKIKNVACVDLTDETETNQSSAKEKNPEINSKIGGLLKEASDKSLLSTCTHTQRIESFNTSCHNFSKPDSNSKYEKDKFSLQTNETRDLISQIMDEDEVSTNERETIDLAAIKQKYMNEYSRYPYPPSLSFHSKPRNRNAMYDRIVPQTENLSIEKVESRLKTLDNVKNQFGNKLGDIVKLDKYPVSNSEVECYHRILGVAPSHKLIPKYFKSPDVKVNPALPNPFYLYSSNQNIDVLSNNQDKPRYEDCSLNDIIQGITESKMMSNNSNSQINTEVFQRDCPSADTRDSFDSHVSSVSDKSSFLVQNEIKSTCSYISENKRIVLPSQDTNSNDHNNAFFHKPDFQNSVKPGVAGDISISSKNLENPESHCSDVNKQSYSLNNLISLKLPTQEVLDTISCNPLTAGYIGNTGNGADSEYNKAQFINNEFCSVSESRDQTNFISSNVEDKTKNLSSFTPLFDLDVSALRKIVEVAGSLTSDSVKNENIAWKSKTTYEYNHTQSVPTVEPYSNPQGTISHVPQKAETANLAKSDVMSNDNLTEQNSDDDDDCINNDPIDNESDSRHSLESDSLEKSKEEELKISQHKSKCEKVMDSRLSRESDSPEKSKEEEPKFPQHKSKWEKIMERKALENEGKKQINEHLLTDCFPVSSKITNKKLSTSDKNSSSKNKHSEVLKKDEGSKPKKQKHKKSKHFKNKEEEFKTKRDSEKLITECKGKKGSKKKSSEPTTKNELAGKKLIEPTSKGADSEKICKKHPKIKLKDTDVNDSTLLFAPDKPIKKDQKKSENIQKTSDNNPSQKFYGNRVSNRGSFLTVTTPNYLKNPKKKVEAPKKAVNVRSEEFHSLVNLSNIEIKTSAPKYKIVNKSTGAESYESYKIITNVENRSSVSSHLEPDEDSQRIPVNIDPCRGDFPSYLDNYKNRENSHNVRRQGSTLIELTPSAMPLPNAPSDLYHSSDEIISSRSINFQSSPSTFVSNDEMIHSPNVSQLNTHLSSFHTTSDNFFPGSVPSLLNTPSSAGENFSGRKVPLLSTPSSAGENFSSRKMPLLSTPSCTSNNFSNTQVPLLSSLSSIGNNFSAVKGPLLSTPSSTVSELPAASVFSPGFGGLLQNILKSVQMNNSSNPLPNDNLPISENMNMPWNSCLPSSVGQVYSEKINFASQSNVINESSTNLNYPNMLTPVYNVPNLTLITSSPNYSFQDQQSHPFTSPPDIPNQIFPQVHKKASSTCLVPQHLKSLVGHKTIETENVRLLMLEWSVDWLVQQQKFHDPPPISSSLKKVVSSYDSFEDHYNTYFPLMLLDTWHRIYVSWTHLSQASPYFCHITLYSVKNTYVSVECQTVFNTSVHPKGIFPDEGSIVMVKYGTKSKDFNIKILGYVTSVKTRHFNPITDLKLGNFKAPKDGNYEGLQVLTLSFMGAYNSEDIDKSLLIRIHVLCNVKSTLKQNDALLYTSKSPLLSRILNPVECGLNSVALTPRNSPQDKINECVRDILKGIMGLHPHLTIVRAVPESDRLNIIPLLIDKMKNMYKTKVLLCVRTVRALGDIAANICLHKSLKLVIVNKRGDTSPQFQKYLLDELVASERKSVEDNSTESLHSKNEAIIRTKKQIFKNCDVVLSLIRNCHDEFMEATFTETESVEQMCCIVDEANLCTEPESLIPILHGISRLILIGDPDYPAKVLSKTASSYDYNRSYFHRAYDLDLITE